MKRFTYLFTSLDYLFVNTATKIIKKAIRME